MAHIIQRPFTAEIKFLSFIFLYAFSCSSSATDFRYSADYEYAYYENINRVTTPKDNEYANTVAGRFTILENSGHLNAAVSAQLTTTQYKNNLTSDRVRGKLSVLSTWVLRPKSIEWFLSDVFTQSTIDSLVSDAPDNQQNVNTLSTGPDFSLRLNPLNRILISPRIESYLFQEGNDNARIKNNLAWEYTINSTVTMQLNHLLEKVDFQDGEVNPDHLRNDIFISLTNRKGLNRLKLEFGHTRINDDLNRTFDNPRFKFSLSSQRNHNTSLNLAYGVKVTDVGKYILSQNAPVSGVDNSSLELFQSSVAELGVVHRISNGSLSLTFKNLLREFEVNKELDQELSSATLSGRLILTGLSKLSFSINRSKQTFLNDVDGRIYNDSNYRINYSYAIRRNVFFNMNVSTKERSSNIAEEDYKSPKISLAIQYSSL